MRVSWRTALAWRLRRHFLDPIGDMPVEEVIRRLGAVQAQHDAATELSIRARRTTSEPGEVAEALAAGRLIKTFAFRGATHLMTPDDAGVYLALRASSRMWELPSWRSYYGLEPSDWPAFRKVVRGLGAIQAQHDAGSELSVRARQTRSEPGEVARALADGRLIKTFAFRGATHLMAPEDAGVYLALRASSRMWELPSWRSYYRLEPSDWPHFLDAVRDAWTRGR